MSEIYLQDQGSGGKLKADFRADLQGLRAVAILLVVFCHSGVPLFASGFVGVDVFFVLSGYLITRLLLREQKVNGRIAFVSFYARRLRRLLPAMAVMLCVAGGSAILVLSGGEVHRQLASAPYAATWTSNFYFTFANFGYFDEPSARDIFLHTWSLAVEEQFYLVWPLTLTVLFLFARGPRTATRRSVLLALLGGVCLISLAASLSWTANAPNTAYYMMPSRIWQFAIGAVVCCLPVPQKRSHKLTSLLLALGLTSILGSAILLPANIRYPGYWALAPSVGAILVIAAGQGAREYRNPLSHPALVWLGDRSYSWYLWHWPLLVIGFSLGFRGQNLTVLGLVLLSLLAAMLSYRFVELPFWKGRYSRTRPRLTVLASAMIVASTVAALFYGVRSQTEPITGSSSLRADVPIIYSMGCDAWYANSRVELCVFGPDEATKTAVLLGDSIGAQWFSAVSAIFGEPDWRTIVLTKSACPIVDEEYFYQRIGATYDVCTEWRNAVIDELTALEPNVIIVGSWSGYDFSRTQWVAGSARIFGRLSEAAKTVFVIAGTPSLGFHGPGCVSRNLISNHRTTHGTCSSTQGIPRAKRVVRYLNDAAKHFPRVHVLTFNDIVCPKGLCSAVSKEGSLVFRDDKHLTDSFVRAKTWLIRERFTAAGALPDQRNHLESVWSTTATTPTAGLVHRGRYSTTQVNR